VLDAVIAGEDEAALRARLIDGGAEYLIADGQAKGFRLPWFRGYLTTDPRPALDAVDVPVLALYGDRDRQVIVAENVPVVREALADNPSATVEVLPGLNHYFQPAESGLPEEYGQIRITFAEPALERVVSFLEERASR